MVKSEKEFDIFENELVSRHEILNDEEKASLLDEFKVTLSHLPRINLDDPVSKKLGVKKGDILKITRTGNNLYYRVVV
jgi:DNA-directed RNA polymerase subunit H (RpoH/RPB5)